MHSLMCQFQCYVQGSIASSSGLAPNGTTLSSSIVLYQDGTNNDYLCSHAGYLLSIGRDCYISLYSYASMLNVTDVIHPDVIPVGVGSLSHISQTLRPSPTNVHCTSGSLTAMSPDCVMYLTHGRLGYCNCEIYQDVSI